MLLLTSCLVSINDEVGTKKYVMDNYGLELEYKSDNKCHIDQMKSFFKFASYELMENIDRKLSEKRIKRIIFNDTKHIGSVNCKSASIKSTYKKKKIEKIIDYNYACDPRTYDQEGRIPSKTQVTIEGDSLVVNMESVEEIALVKNYTLKARFYDNKFIRRAMGKDNSQKLLGVDVEALRAHDFSLERDQAPKDLDSSRLYSIDLNLLNTGKYSKVLIEKEETVKTSLRCGELIKREELVGVFESMK